MTGSALRPQAHDERVSCHSKLTQSCTDSVSSACGDRATEASYGARSARSEDLPHHHSAMLTRRSMRGATWYARSMRMRGATWYVITRWAVRQEAGWTAGKRSWRSPL